MLTPGKSIPIIIIIIIILNYVDVVVRAAVWSLIVPDFSLLSDKINVIRRPLRNDHFLRLLCGSVVETRYAGHQSVTQFGVAQDRMAFVESSDWLVGGWMGGGGRL